jgi:D-3-phosphoglycerate dehydrogenase / 2-oxoglutarate reductase
MMNTAAVTDHVFPSLDLQRRILEDAGFRLDEIKPACKTEDDVIQRCSAADVLLVQWAPISRRVLEALPNVKCLVRYGIGVDNIDLKAAKDLGRTVANVPNYCFEEVSNHAIAMILSLGRRIPQDHQQITQGGWGIKQFLPIPAFSDLTLGLLGFGSIARRVADKAKIFGFRIIASDPFAKDADFQERGVERVTLETLVKTADVLSLHCPLVPETRHIIRREAIDQMKPGSILINTSRGGLINEEDLAHSLSDGKIVGAGLDVFEREPLNPESPLLRFPNVILTSHAASVSESARRKLQTLAAENARDFLMHKRPQGTLVSA